MIYCSSLKNHSSFDSQIWLQFFCYALCRPSKIEFSFLNRKFFTILDQSHQFLFFSRWNYAKFVSKKNLNLPAEFKKLEVHKIVSQFNKKSLTHLWIYPKYCQYKWDACTMWDRNFLIQMMVLLWVWLMLLYKQSLCLAMMICRDFVDVDLFEIR